MSQPPLSRHILQGLLALVLWVCAVVGAPAQAQGVELVALRATRADGALNLEFSARVSLPRAVEDALQRGVPIYFVAEAQLLRNRWYWRDERVAHVSRSWRIAFQRVAHVSRSWRIAFQPLTGAWKLSLGGLSQTYSSLHEALATASRSAGWKLAELSQLDADENYYVEFSYRLDTTQLPSPMQFGLSGPGGQGEWAVGASRVIKVES